MALESLPKIAPALFSAEQDLIQIYNKKSDTVGTINASYIGGSTPPSGVSGAIQFSNGSAFASDAANLFWDDANNRLGVGTNNPYAATFQVKGGGADITTNAVFVENSVGLPALIIRNNGTVNLPGNLFAEANISVGSSSSLGARLGIIGSGSTSATTSFLVQNSSGSEAFRVYDDSLVVVGSVIQSNNFAVGQSNPNYKGITQSGGRIQLNYVNNGGVKFSNSSTGFGTLIVGEVSENMVSFGGITSSFPALKRNGTAIDVRLADDSNYASLNTGATLIKGSGSTSATTSLLVQNSGGSVAFQVKDNQQVQINFGNTLASAATPNLTFSSSQTGVFSPNPNQLGIACYGNETARFIYGNSLHNGALNIGKFANPDNNAFFGWCSDGSLEITGNAQSVFVNPTNNSSMVIGASTAQATAILQADSTTKGFLPPRMTDAQIRAIATPAEGLIAYNTDINHLCCYQNGAWAKFSHSPM